MRECHDPQHLVLPLDTATGVTSASYQGLCVTCLTNQFSLLTTPASVRAIQDTVLLLKQSFHSFCEGQHKCTGSAGVVCDVSPSGNAPAPPGNVLCRFSDVLVQLATRLCVEAPLHRHISLYKAALSLLNLIFTLLDDSACAIVSDHTFVAQDYTDSRSLSAYDMHASAKVVAVQQETLVKLALCLCTATLSITENRKSEDTPSTVCLLLLLIDLSDMNTAFLPILARFCLPSLCALMLPVHDAHAVELLLYMLWRVCETCARHPNWLEGLARELASATFAVSGGGFIDYLTWALETFRGDEPVVINALCLTRFVVVYETTRAVLFPTEVGNVDMSNSHFPKAVSRLVRCLTLLLLHINVDVVVAAAESLCKLFVTTHYAHYCPDVADYLIESLRTASPESASALVRLLNTLPCAAVPSGPTLCVMFEIANIDGKAFELVVEGPHFLAAFTNSATNLNDVARQILQLMRGGNSISLSCFLLQVDILAGACRQVRGVGAGVLIPEIGSSLVSMLLHLLCEFCGAAPTGQLVQEGWVARGDEVELNGQRGLLDSRFCSLSREAKCCLFRSVGFLVSYCEAALLDVSCELLAEAMWQWLHDGTNAKDTERTYDPKTGSALLQLGATVFRRLADDSNDPCQTSDWFRQQLGFLLGADLLTMLLCLPAASSTCHALLVCHFLRLAPSNREGSGVTAHLKDLPITHGGACSPPQLLNASFHSHPLWAASFLLALAVAGCPQPVEAAVLDIFLYEQLSLLPFDGGGGEKFHTHGLLMGGSGVGDMVCDRGYYATVELTALNVSAALYVWRGELPQQCVYSIDGSYWAGVAYLQHEEGCRHMFELLQSAEPRWLDALGACDWGMALLASMVSSSVLQMESKRSEELKCPHDYLFSSTASSLHGVQLTICRLMVRHAISCSTFITPLFGAVRDLAGKKDCSFACHIIAFLCCCVNLVVAEGTEAATPFVCLLLERHLTPLLLYIDVSILTGYVARLVVLLLARISVEQSSCCDHTILKWAIHSIRRYSSQVYLWHIICLLLQRAHGNEFALRHELELCALLRLQCVDSTDPSSTVVLVTMQWLVEGEMWRRGVRPTKRLVPLPLREWSHSPPDAFALRAFVISSVERRMEVGHVEREMAGAAPLLLGWANEMCARRHAVSSSARLFYLLLNEFPQLSASLEVLGFFLQLTEPNCMAAHATETLPAIGVAERAWLFAALISCSPPWAMSSGLHAAVETFLGCLAEGPEHETASIRTERPCESPVSAGAAADPGCHADVNVHHAVRALVKACEHQPEPRGKFSLNRAKDFFLRQRHAPTIESNVTANFGVVFRPVHEDCELFL
ncbi:hypothetical protein ERJ75_000770200 [Trypanosoma vivax]|nr:hypothetical protein TRVL_06126 [Trypanosoma vivax]KAH8614078.1 hypothetical protein ERJ75_000770200 [Trypanosoma vivax]